MNKVIWATNFAAIAHRNQRRKDQAKTPYINHPIEVMTLLSQAGVVDVNTLCAAVLHDTIEDTDVTYEQLVKEFGKETADIVKECSDDKSLPKEVRKQEQILHAKVASASAKLVKTADKLSNLGNLDSNPPADWSKDTIDGYFTWSYAVWLNIRGHNDLLDSQLRALFAKRGLYDLSNRELHTKLDVYYNSMKN